MLGLLGRKLGENFTSHFEDFSALLLLFLSHLPQQLTGIWHLAYSN
jgi:hypothetical protein